MPRRRDWLWGAGLCALALSVIADALLSGGTIVPSGPRHDLPAQFLAWREFGFSELAKGNLALWNPHLFSGIPFFAGFESALLYPPNWAHLWLSPGAGVNLVIALHLCLAGALSYAWARRRGVSPPGAFVAGAAYMLSGPFFLRLYAGHLPPLCVMALTPALLCCVEAWLATGTARWWLAGALAGALMLLAGNPQFAYFAALGAAALAATRLGSCQRPAARALGLLGMAAGSAALAAVQLLPGLEAALGSVRASASPEFSAALALPPENLATIVAPYLFGDLSRFPYYGRSYLWEACLFAGAGTLALAGAATSARPARALLACAGLFVLLALGAYTPLHELLRSLLPGYAMLRGAGKFAFVATLFLSAAAGAGYDALAEKPERGRRVALGCAAAAALLLALSALAPGLAGQARLVFSSSLRAAALALGAAAGLAWAGRRRAWARQALAGLAVLELLVFAARARGSAPSAPEYPVSWKELLAGGNGDERVLHDFTSFPNAALPLRARDAWGYSALVPRRYAEFMAFTQGVPPDLASQYIVFSRDSPLLDLVRLRWVLGASGRALARKDALPRALLVGDFSVVAERDAALKALSHPSFDPRKVALLERPPRPSPLPGGAKGSVRVLSETTDTLELAAELPAPALLLLTDSYDPGWTARALEPGPQPAPGPQPEYELLAADYALKAVPLAAGRHRLLLEYSPRSFRIGARLSAFSWLLWAAAGIHILLRRRTDKNQPRSLHS